MTTGYATFKDGALIALALTGNTECFDALVDRHQSAVRRRVKSMLRNNTDEDDLVQEVFLKAWRALASFRSQASFRTWISHIATNEVMQLYRRESHSPTHLATIDLDTFASKFDSPQQALEQAEAAETIQNAIAKLPRIYRQILVLRDLKQLSEIETARSLRATKPMVKSRLFRARRMLAAALERQDRRVELMRAHPISHAAVVPHVDVKRKAA